MLYLLINQKPKGLTFKNPYFEEELKRILDNVYKERHKLGWRHLNAIQSITDTK